MISVKVGVTLAVLTGWYWLDPALALLVAVNILWSGWVVVWVGCRLVVGWCEGVGRVVVRTWVVVVVGVVGWGRCRCATRCRRVGSR